MNEIAALLARARENIRDAQETRQIGDYGMDMHIPSPQAAEKLDHAREFLKAAEDYLQSQSQG